MGIDVDFPRAFAKSPGRGLRRAAHQRAGVRVGRRPRQAGDAVPDEPARGPRLRDPGHGRHRGDAAPQRHLLHRGPQAQPGPRPRRRADHHPAHPRRRRGHGRQHARPGGRPAPTATTSGPRRPRSTRPIITTVQQLSAAVQGIEADRRRRLRRGQPAAARRRDLRASGRPTGDARPGRRAGPARRRRPGRPGPGAGPVVLPPTPSGLPAPRPGRARRGPGRPGQFAAARGRRPGRRRMLLRRAFSVHRADPAAGTLERRRGRPRPGHGAGCAGGDVGDVVDVVAPLGTGFTLPAAGERLVLVGGGLRLGPVRLDGAAAAAPRRGRGRRGRGRRRRPALRRRRHPVRGRGHRRARLHVTTDDGSAGRRGRVTDALADLLPGPAPGRPGRPWPRAGRWPCSAAVAAHRAGRPPRRPDAGRRRAGRGRGGDGLRHRHLHDVRAAGPRRRRARPGCCAPAPRARSWTPSGSAGTASVPTARPCPPTPSVRPRAVPREQPHDAADPTRGPDTAAPASPAPTPRCPVDLRRAGGADGQRLRGRGPRAGPVPGPDRPRRGGHQDDHARGPVGPAHAADGRDPVGDAQLHRAAGPRRRAVPRAPTCRGWPGAGPAPWSAWRGRTSGSSSRSPPPRREATTGDGDGTGSLGRPGMRRRGARRGRGQHLLPQRGQPRPGVRLRPRHAPPTSCPPCVPRPTRGCRCWPSCRPDVTDIVAIAASVLAGGRRRPGDGQHAARAWPSTSTGAAPVLSRVTGGLSGPAIRPVAVRCIWQVHAAMRAGLLPSAPIVGVGGVRTGRDAAELVLAGAARRAGRHRHLRRPAAPRPGAGRSWRAVAASRGAASLAELGRTAHERRPEPEDTREPTLPATRRSPSGCRRPCASTARSASAWTRRRRRCPAGASADDVGGLERFCGTVIEALAGRTALLKPQVAFFERHGSARPGRAGAAAGRLPLRGAARPGRRQARGHRLHGGRLRRRVAGPALAAGRRRRHGVAVPGLRQPGPARRGRRDARSGRVRAVPDVQPRGRLRAARPPGRRARRQRRRRRGARPRLSTTPVSLPGAAVRPSVPARSGSSSGPRSARQLEQTGVDLAAVGGHLLLPGLGAQGATAADVARHLGGLAGLLVPSASREVLHAGPDLQALRDQCLLPRRGARVLAGGLRSRPVPGRRRRTPPKDRVGPGAGAWVRSPRTR